jgi:hypothetical protein
MEARGLVFQLDATWQSGESGFLPRCTEIYLRLELHMLLPDLR